MTYVSADAFRQFEKRMDERWDRVEERLDAIGGEVTVIAQAQVAKAWLGPRGSRLVTTMWALLATVVVAIVSAVVTFLLGVS